MLICCQKTSILWKTMLSCHFFWIFVKNPYCYAHIWSEKCQFCQNYIRLWSQKVNRMAFLPIFDKKSLLSFPYFVKINVYFLENKRLSCPYLVKKRQFFQKHGALISFLYNFLWKTPAVIPIFGQKTSILSKLHNIICQKSQYDALFFRFFSKKKLYSCPYFVKKTAIL